MCGAGASEFKVVKPAPAVTAKAIMRWECTVCGYIHEGAAPPDSCPLCGADAKLFRPLVEAVAAASTGSAARIIIVGAGIAGLSAAEEARRASPNARIILLSADTEYPYYRLNLTRYLAGEITRADLPIHPAEWYSQHQIELRLHTQVTHLDLPGHQVELDSGEKLPFDKLILASGAHPFVPPLPGGDLPGVISVRTVQDADRLLELAKPGKRCLCVGGGLLGLETAGALARRGVQVGVLESHEHLMPTQLDSAAGDFLSRHLDRIGVQLHRSVHVKSMAGEKQLTGVILEEGPTLPADVVVFATGVRATSHLARQAGLEVQRGVVIDNLLATSHPDVLAAGDVTEHLGVIYGNWSVAQTQGRAAGRNAAGLPAEFPGVPRAHTLKVLGIDTFSIGQFNPMDGSYRRLAETTEKHYQSFIFHEGFLVGANLVGEASLAGQVRAAVELRTNFSVLLSQQPTVSAVITALPSEASRT